MIIVVRIVIMVINRVDHLYLVHGFSLEISLEKYKKIINSPLIIIRMNIRGSREFDFVIYILMHRIILYIMHMIRIGAGCSWVVRRRRIIIIIITHVTLMIEELVIIRVKKVFVQEVVY